MRILVTGGAGYLGETISNSLLGRGYELRIFGKTAPKWKETSREYEVQLGDILSTEDLKKACAKIDSIIHLAALDTESCQMNPELAVQVNGFGTRNLLNVAEKAGVRLLVYFSTFHVYGNRTGTITEDTVPNPINDYGISKLLGEFFCRQSREMVRNVTMRLSNGYGPSTTRSGWNLVVNNLCLQCFKNQVITLRSKGRQKRNFVSTKDIAQAVQLLLSKDPEEVNNRILNVGGPDTLSIHELATIVAKLYLEHTGRQVNIVIEEDVERERFTEFEYSYKKIQAMGYTPRSSLQTEVPRIFQALESPLVNELQSV